MGQDKASLQIAGRTLIERIAAEVLAAAGQVTVVGGPERHGFRVIPDAIPRIGPFCGIISAIEAAGDAFSLVVSCDLPYVNRGFLSSLIECAQATSGCVVPQTAGGQRHPLCAVFAPGAGHALRLAAGNGVRRVLDAVDFIHGVTYLPCEPEPLLNVNTPEEWHQAVMTRERPGKTG